MTQPKVQINIYSDMVTLTQRRGRSIRTYLVDADTLVNKLSGTKIMSPLLPPNMIGWGIKDKKPWCVAYFKRRVQTVTIARSRGRVETFTLPLPPAILMGSGTSYQLAAIKRRPHSMSSHLYLYPAPNVGGGNICQGTAVFPEAAPDTMAAAYDAFLNSRFSPHDVTQRCVSYPNDIIELWRSLDGKTKFPLNELVKANATLASLYQLPFY